MSMMIRLIGIGIWFSWCASILQVLSKHLLEEGMYIALLMYKPCALLFPKFNVKSEKAKRIYITRFTSKEVGIAAFQTCSNCVSNACKTCRGPTARKSSTYTKIWTQIWRVAGRESGSPELLGSPRTSPEVPRTSPEVFRRLPRKFSH